MIWVHRSSLGPRASVADDCPLQGSVTNEATPSSGLVTVAVGDRWLFFLFFYKNFGIGATIRTSQEIKWLPYARISSNKYFRGSVMFFGLGDIEVSVGKAN